jgi:hypothetical protein
MQRLVLVPSIAECEQVRASLLQLAVELKNVVLCALPSGPLHPLNTNKWLKFGSFHHGRLLLRSNVRVTRDLREEAAQRPDAARRRC